MDSSGHLASVGWQAFILNSYLFIPLGFLVYLHFLCGDSIVPASPRGTEVRDVKAAEPSIKEESEKRTLANTVLKSILICVATSLLIELLQKITELGMLDISDLIANSIGGGVGVVLVFSYVRQHVRRSECREVV